LHLCRACFRFSSIAIFRTENYIYKLSKKSATFTTGQAVGNHGWADVFIVKMDSMGNYLWSGCYGGIYDERGNDVLITDDGSIIFIGEVNSNNGDVGSIHVAPDCWVVKLAAEPMGVSDLNNPITQLSANISGGKCTVTYSSKQYGDFYLRMFDLLGKEIYSRKIKSVVGKNEFTFDIESSPGIKIIQLQNENSNAVVKVFAK